MTTIRITPSSVESGCPAARERRRRDRGRPATRHREIRASVATHGPIMHQFKAAANDVVARRESAFADHEAAHRAAADNLRSIAKRFAGHLRPGGTRLGHTLGVQIEPAAMKRPAIDIAQGIMACNDVAYLRGQLVIRAELGEVDSGGRYAH